MSRVPTALAAAVAVWAVLWAPTGAAGQLIFDDTPLYERYYAEYGYWPYTADIWSQTKRPVFDALGNFVMSGDEVWRTEEARPRFEGLDGSLLDKGNGYSRWLNHLVIAQDSYQTWSSRLIVGDQIRTKFTSLTLDLAGLNGVRWDVDTGAGELSLIASRYDWPNFLSGVRSGSGGTPVDNVFHGQRRRPTYLLGGHYEREIGALNLAFTYVNMNRTNSTLDWGEHSLRGVLPEEITSPPVWIAVKVSDGSDRDDGGPRVFDMYIDGPLGEHAEAVVTRHDSRVIDQRFPNGDEFFLPGKEIPPYIEFIRGALDPVTPGAQGFHEANGTEYLIYWFEIPEAEGGQVERIRFRARVANDYRVSVSEVFADPNLGIEGHRATYWYDVVSQKGNVQDASNERWIEFEYGRQSGRTTASVRADLETLGLEVHTEYARTFDFRQYPSPSGIRKWETSTADAFFVNALRQWGMLGVGGEYFRMDPRYSTSLSIQNGEYRSYSDLLGSPFPEVEPNWGLRYNYTLDLNTVDDNDDKDVWPDFHFLPQSFGDTDGVFPGLDRDQNGRADIDENGNGLPDYVEPFFLYKVDREEYDYGEDLNNNGVIDHREDDNDPDYPYEVDSKGHHLFIEIAPLTALNLSVGRYDVRQIWGAGRNRVSYAKARYERTLYPWVRVDFANVLKDVRDDIRDDTPQFTFIDQHGLVASSAKVIVEDQLLMENSLVNTAYVDATLLRVPNLTVNSRLKNVQNRQRETVLVPHNAVQEWAWVLRADYVLQLQQLRVTPKFKYTMFRRTDEENRVNEISERVFHPMLIAEYPLTDRTSIRVGAQGAPFLKSTYRNPLNPEVDYDAQDYVALVSSTTTYEGHVMALDLGYQLSKVRFADRRRSVQDIDRSQFFLRLVMGVEPFQG